MVIIKKLLQVNIRVTCVVLSVTGNQIIVLIDLFCLMLIRLIGLRTVLAHHLLTSRMNSDEIKQFRLNW